MLITMMPVTDALSALRSPLSALRPTAACCPGALVFSNSIQFRFRRPLESLFIISHSLSLICASDTRSMESKKPRKADGSIPTEPMRSSPPKRQKTSGIDPTLSVEARCRQRLSLESPEQQFARMNRDLTLGEQVIRNPLIRDKILSHFNPYDIALTDSLRASPMIGSLAHSLTHSLARSLAHSPTTHHPPPTGSTGTTCSA